MAPHAHSLNRPSHPFNPSFGFRRGSCADPFSLSHPSIDHLLSPRGSLVHCSGFVLFPSSGSACLLASFLRGQRHPPEIHEPFVTCPTVRRTWGRPERMGGDPSLPPSVTRHPPWFRPSPTIVRSMRPQRPPPDGTEHGKDPHHHRMDTIGERAWQRAFHRPKS